MKGPTDWNKEPTSEELAKEAKVKNDILRYFKSLEGVVPTINERLKRTTLFMLRKYVSHYTVGNVLKEANVASDEELGKAVNEAYREHRYTLTPDKVEETYLYCYSPNKTQEEITTSVMTGLIFGGYGTSDITRLIKEHYVTPIENLDYCIAKAIELSKDVTQINP